ncbi:MAG: carboxypeptidase regulatory-like domain-containing protein [Gemmatimonadales bacterium]
MASLGSRRTRVAVMTCVACCAPLVTRAQTQFAGLVGVVRDSAGHALRDAEVRINGSFRLAAITNDSGGFRLASLVPGATTLMVRRLGFAPDTEHVILRPGRTDSLVLALTSVAATLPGVLVQDAADERSHRLLADFWARRDKGFGSFITRQEIEQRDAHSFVDLTRMIPSLRVVTVNGRPALRFNRSVGGRDCPPQYVVDGMRIVNGSPDEFSPSDLEAVEIYAGPATTPPQFVSPPYSYTCGAIVIWTRLPGT